MCNVLHLMSNYMLDFNFWETKNITKNSKCGILPVYEIYYFSYRYISPTTFISKTVVSTKINLMSPSRCI